MNTVRERCIICGMVANIDPYFHAERYGHVPEVRRYDRVHRFDFTVGVFVPVVER